MREGSDERLPDALPARRVPDVLGPGVVLVGLDDSPTSWDAFAWAVGHASRTGARLVAVYVSACTTAASISGRASAELLLAQRAAQTEIAQALRDEAAGLAAEQGVALSFEQREGEAGHQLLEAACEHAADLVVVGTSRRLRHRLVGSVSKKLAGCRQVPVVIVP